MLASSPLSPSRQTPSEDFEAPALIVLRQTRPIG